MSGAEDCGSMGTRFNTRAYLQVLGSYSLGVPPAILASFDRQKVLFNVPEGFQRIATEHGVKIGKTSHVLMTRLAWDTIGGLPGTMLTLRDAHVPRVLNIAGPKGLTHILNNGKSAGFPRQKQTQSKKQTQEAVSEEREAVEPPFGYQVTEITNSGQVVYHNPDSMTVQAILVKPSKGIKRNRDGQRSVVESSVVCYIGRTPDYRGKFRPDKAMELGVPKGSLFANLCSGKSVALDDGRVIYPNQVMEETRKGFSFAIIDCPSVDYVESLVNDSVFSKFITPNQQLDVVVHLTGHDVLENSKEYLDWSSSFGSQVQHFVINSESTIPEVVFYGSTELTKRLSQCCSRLFTENTFPVKGSGISNRVYDMLGEANVKSVQNLYIHDISFRKSGGDLSEAQRALKKGQLHPAFEILPKTDGEYAGVVSSNDSSFFSDAKFTFLGTGSACPSKYRNCSGMILEFDETAALFDPSEGSYSQLVRLRGIEKAQEFIDKVSLIWISHVHGDHHFGLLSFLNRRSSDSPRVTLIAPTGILSFLHQYRSRSLDCVSFVGIESVMMKDWDKVPLALKQTLKNMHISRLVNIPVIHCYDAYGLLLEHEKGWKFVFSGDTAPCEKLAEVGHGATVLVHEATFADDCLEEARSRKHCTSSDALCIAHMMGAKHTILSHFSQRYPKFSSASSVKGVESLDVIAAWDFLSVRFVDLEVASKMLYPLERLLEQALDNVEDEEQIEVKDV